MDESHCFDERLLPEEFMRSCLSGLFLASGSCSGYIFEPREFNQVESLPRLRYLPSAILPIFIIGFLCPLLYAQTPGQPQADTLKPVLQPRDTTYALQPDTLLTVELDTTRMSSPSLVGTLDRLMDSTKYLNVYDLRFMDYTYLGGILENFPGVFLRDQHGAGQYSQLTIRGVDWRSISVSANGRPMNDPLSGVYNLYHFAPEYADRIEVITGPRAFLYGVNATGGAVNLVTKNYNSNKPFSKINYSESFYSYAFSDGTFSQNISRKMNVTVGFQHQSHGGRFANSAHDAWTVRAKVRYNVSKDFNIILSEYLSRTETQLNGGIDLIQTGIPAFAFDRIQAEVVNRDAFEKTTRNDVDLSFVGTFMQDTVNVTTLTFYYSNSFREYRDKEFGISNGVKIDSDHRSSWMGAHFTQDLRFAFQQLSLGANIELRQIEGSPNLGRRRNSLGSLWAKEEIRLSNIVGIAGFVRYDNYMRQSGFGFGADATINIGEWVSLYGGLSSSKRFPGYQEMFWSDSTVTRSGSITSERHRTFELGGIIRYGGIQAQASFFHRTVENPILVKRSSVAYVFPSVEFSNGGKLITNGVEMKLNARIAWLALDATGTFITQQDENSSSLARYPKLSARGGIYYWNRILNDKLSLKIGLRGRYVSGSSGDVFNPEVIAYVPNNGPDLGYGASVDGFLIAGIGSAYIHFMWENLTNSRYYITPYYPVLDRAVRFGISWQFFD